MEQNIKKFSEFSDEVITLYHGTSPGSADLMIKYGWSPNTGLKSGNQGKSNYLYLTTDPEDARWFSNEIGHDCILEIKNIPIKDLIPDPEDSAGFSMEELLDVSNRIPSKFALTRSIKASHFKIFNFEDQ